MIESNAPALRRDYIDWVDVSSAVALLKRLPATCKYYNRMHPHSAPQDAIADQAYPATDGALATSAGVTLRMDCIRKYGCIAASHTSYSPSRQAPGTKSRRHQAQHDQRPLA